MQQAKFPLLVNPLFTPSLAKGNTQKKEPKQNEIKVKGKIRPMRDIKEVQMFILWCLKNKIKVEMLFSYMVPLS